MTFDEILAQVLQLLQRQGRVSYRALKRQFSLDDEYLEDLKAEIIDAKRLAIDEEGKVLVWVGKEKNGQMENWAKGKTDGKINATPNPQPPVSYTPKHLADRILAEQ